MVAERYALDESTDNAQAAITTDNRGRWIAVAVLCLGQLMLTLDATVANVALPAIQRELHFSQSCLAWVINGYLITFGGLLLPAGRLGDLLGRRRVFLAGLAFFTLASLLCGLASSQGVLIAARCLQGVAAAGDSAMILGILVTIFPNAADTAKAMGVYAFVAVSGGTIGLLVGGVLTQALSWHWIFFINIPIGIVALVLGFTLIPDHQGVGLHQGIDFLGALLVTATPALAVYTIIQAGDNGSHAGRTIILGAAAIILACAFVWVEGRIADPLVPLRVFRSRNVSGVNLIRVLLAFSMFGLFFLGALYMQHVLGYGALQTGFAFLPMTLIVAVLSLFVTRRVTARLGAKTTLIAGLVLSTASNLLFARASVTGNYFIDLLPVMVLAGVGAGLAFMPSVTLAMSGAGPGDSGLVSGLANVSTQMGAALGVAILASLATGHTNDLLAHGHAMKDALTSGYDRGFIVAGVGDIVAGALAVLVLRAGSESPSAR